MALGFCVTMAALLTKLNGSLQAADEHPAIKNRAGFCLYSG
ncbi:hypothetical protein CSC17_5670 [Klebsiella oxytoca]|nr:hypothetical protein CSC17_5670 [Klebsiella oxytoca]